MFQIFHASSRQKRNTVLRNELLADAMCSLRSWDLCLEPILDAVELGAPAGENHITPAAR